MSMSGAGACVAEGSGGEAQVLQDDRACPAVIEVQRFLLLDDFFRRERRVRLLQQVEVEFGNRQVQRLFLRGRARLWNGLTIVDHHRADPTAVEILLRLLSLQFFWREWWEWLVQQFHFELGDRQEQRLRGTHFGVDHITLTLLNDVRVQLAAQGRFFRAVQINRRECAAGWHHVTRLFGQGLGKKILPQVTDAAQCLSVMTAEVALGRDVANRCGKNA